MKTITSDELKLILEKHEKWLKGEAEGERAILIGYDLRNSDFSDSDLRGSVLWGSDFRHSDLSGSNLSGSNLRYSDLRGSDLRNSDLRGSVLWGSDFRHSDLSGSDLRGIDLDFYSWPLWCGTRNVKVDENIVYQLLLHINWLDNDCKVLQDIRALPSFQRAIKKAAKKRDVSHERTEGGGDAD